VAKRKPNDASKKWNQTHYFEDTRYAQRVGQPQEQKPKFEAIPAVKCPRCGMLGHGVDAHFDQHQFAGKREAIRDVEGNEIGDFNND
jgi:hypothetical protein